MLCSFLLPRFAVLGSLHEAFMVTRTNSLKVSYIYFLILVVVCFAIYRWLFCLRLPIDLYSLLIDCTLAFVVDTLFNLFLVNRTFMDVFLSKQSSFLAVLSGLPLKTIGIWRVSYYTL